MGYGAAAEKVMLEWMVNGGARLRLGVKNYRKLWLRLKDKEWYLRMEWNGVAAVKKLG